MYPFNSCHCGLHLGPLAQGHCVTSEDRPNSQDGSPGLTALPCSAHWQPLVQTLLSWMLPNTRPPGSSGHLSPESLQDKVGHHLLQWVLSEYRN